MFACHESQLVDFELPRRGGGSLLSDERAVLGVWEEPQLEVTCLLPVFLLYLSCRLTS